MMLLNKLVGWQGYAAAALVAATLATGSALYAAHLYYGSEIAGLNTKSAQIAQAQAEDWTRKIAQARGKELAAAQAYADIDTRMTAKLKEKQDENDNLAAAVNAGTVSLRLAGTCPANRPGVPTAASAAGVGHAGAPELDAAARPTYNALRAGIERQRVQILTLQALLRAGQAAK